MNLRVAAWAALLTGAAAAWLAYVLPPATLGSISEWSYLQSLPSWISTGPLQAHWFNLALALGGILALTVSVAKLSSSASNCYLLLPLLIAIHPSAASLLDRAESLGAALGFLLAALALLSTSLWLPTEGRSKGWLFSGIILGAASVGFGGEYLLCGGLIWQALQVSDGRRRLITGLALASSIPLWHALLLQGIALEGVSGAIQSMIVPQSAAAENAMQRRLAVIVPLTILLLLGWWFRRDEDNKHLVGAAALFIVGCLGMAAEGENAGAALAAICGLSLLLAVGTSRLLPDFSDTKTQHQPGLAPRSVALGALLLLAFAGMNTARLNHMAVHIDRDVLARCRTQVESLSGNPYVPLVDLLIGVPGNEELWAGLYPDRRLNCRDHLMDPGEGNLLQVSAWVPENGLTAGEVRSYQLRTRLRALRVKSERLKLEGPKPQSRLSCLSASDEPTFAWSVREKDDPGGAGFTFCWTAKAQGDAKPQIKSKRLPASTLARGKGHDGRIHYQWRPSIRSADGAHRELLWEHQELVQRGEEMVWTILASKRPRGLLMAKPWSLKTESNQAGSLLASK